MDPKKGVYEFCRVYEFCPGLDSNSNDSIDSILIVRVQCRTIRTTTRKFPVIPANTRVAKLGSSKLYSASFIDMCAKFMVTFIFLFRLEFGYSHSYENGALTSSFTSGEEDHLHAFEPKWCSHHDELAGEKRRRLGVNQGRQSSYERMLGIAMTGKVTAHPLDWSHTGGSTNRSIMVEEYRRYQIFPSMVTVLTELQLHKDEEIFRNKNL